MKFSAYITFFLFSILFSCQKKGQENNTILASKALKDYLEIPFDNNSILIGKLNSINEDVKKDYNIVKKNDTIFIFKSFLESDNFDGKELSLQQKNDNIKKIVIKYNISYLFNGTEKENRYLDLNYIFSINLNSTNIIPDFQNVIQDKAVTNYLQQNSSLIKNLAYNNYINYFKNIPENDLKNCCISDYKNYTRIKDFSESNRNSLDLEEDLGTYLDYKYLVIDIELSSGKKNIIVFNKENSIEKEQSKPNKNSLSITNKPKTWKGNYEITTKAISDYDNKEFDLYYAISIESESSSILSIGADHSEDYWCEGSYNLQISDNIIHASGKCDQDDVNDFYIKYQEGNYYIKSKRFLSKDWLELKKE